MADPTSTLEPRPGDSTNMLLQKILLNLADLPGTFLTPAEGDARYIKLDGTSTVVDGFTLTSAGSIALTAGGTNESITLTPSGTGAVQVNAYSSPDTGSRFTVGESGAGVVSSLVSYGGSVSLRGFAAGGTIGSPTYTTINQILGRITGSGWFNGSFSPSTKASVSMLASATWTDTSTPTLVQFTVTPVGTTTAITPVSIRSTGALQVGESNVSTAAWGVNGVVFSAKSPTITDSSSAGTVATAVASNFAAPTFAASSATIFTDAANLYIAGDVAAGTNVTLTNSYGLWNVGKTRLDGVLALNRNTAPSTGWFDGAVLTGANATNTAWQIDTFAGQARYDIRRANGTKASPTALANADAIGGIAARGYNGSAYSGTTGSLLFLANGGWGGSNLGTYATLAIVPSGQLTQITAATFGANSLLSLGVNATFSTWTTTGVVLNSIARTYTDNTSMGTVAATNLHSFAASTIAATSATTFTDAANVYIAGAPIQGTNATLTRSHALWIDDGSFRLDGTTGAGAGLGTLTNAPSAGDPDKWIPINSDGTQFWIPAWSV